MFTGVSTSCSVGLFSSALGVVGLRERIAPLLLLLWEIVAINSAWISRNHEESSEGEMFSSTRRSHITTSNSSLLSMSVNRYAPSRMSTVTCRSFLVSVAAVMKTESVMIVGAPIPPYEWSPAVSVRLCRDIFSESSRHVSVWRS